MSRTSWSLCFSLCLAVSACGGDGSPGTGPSGALGVPDPDPGPSVDGDIDGDGVADDSDSCPSIANADQRDGVCAYPPTPPAATGDLVADGLARLNFRRAELGLPPVREDADQTRGCRLHVDYLLALAEETGRPQLSHTEDLSKPYASEEGNQAGVDSVLSLGRSDIAEAVDGWLNTLYHRLPLIHPGLATVGVHAANGVACVQYRPGTDGSAVTPHPVMWPAPDIRNVDPQFGGAESPCPTAENPLGGGGCPASGAIATLGLHGLGAISNVMGRITRLDTGDDVPLFKTYWDGGPTPHEMMGFLGGSIALIPEPESALVPAPYEVRIAATVGGEARTFRWRFLVGEGVPDDFECDFFGPQGTFDTAVTVTEASIVGAICDAPDFFFLRSTGTFRVSLSFERSRGDLELYVYDGAGTEIGSATEGATLVVDGVPGESYIEVRGRGGDMGSYQLLIEAGPSAS